MSRTMTCKDCIHWGFCDVFYSEGADHCSSFKNNTEEDYDPRRGEEQQE